MIQAKYRYEGEENWNYKEFNSEEEMLKVLDEDPKQIVEYNSKKKEINNPIKNWFRNIKNTKKNIKTVQGSPYARLVLAYKARIIIVGLIMVYIAFRIFDMVYNFKGSGSMAIVTKLFMAGIGAFICWKFYETIPRAKRQIEYYRKYPHLMNYVPTSAKESIDDIFKTIKKNKEKK